MFQQPLNQRSPHQDRSSIMPTNTRELGHEISDFLHSPGQQVNLRDASLLPYYQVHPHHSYSSLPPSSDVDPNYIQRAIAAPHNHISPTIHYSYSQGSPDEGYIGGEDQINDSDQETGYHLNIPPQIPYHSKPVSSTR